MQISDALAGVTPRIWNGTVHLEDSSYIICHLVMDYLDGSVQERSNSIANALE